MPSRSMSPIRRTVRQAALVVGMLSLANAAALAQVQVTLFETYPSTPPDPNLPFPGGAVICSGTAVGTATGFSLDFNNATTRTSLCPSNPDRFVPAQGDSFGGRFTGLLVAPSAGTYSLFINADDGNRLSVNGAVVRTDWVVKASGPGTVGSIQLNAGENPFVLDYFQGPAVGGFITLQVGAGLVVTPPTNPTIIPEPGSLVLAGSGLALLGAAAARRRRTA